MFFCENLYLCNRKASVFTALERLTRFLPHHRRKFDLEGLPKIYSMRKTFLSLVALLVGVVAAYAQPSSWNYVGDNAYGYSHVVYAGLVDSKGDTLSSIDSNTWLGAFIGNECRGVSQVLQYPPQGEATFQYFPVRIYGDASDNGKAITFRLMTQDYDGNDVWEYILDSTSITYINEGTTGEPSKLFTMTFVQPRYFTFPENIEVKVNETVNLKELITFDPANSSMPISLGEWQYGNSAEFISITDDVLKGLKPTDNAWLGMPNEFRSIKSVNENYFTTVKVIQPATDISIKEEYASSVVHVDDSVTLTRILKSCYTLTPADANEEVTWTWTPEDGIGKTTTENNEIWYNPKTAGRYKLEAKVGNLSATMALTVLNYVQNITATVDTIHLFVGDDLSTLLPYTVTFTPSEYIDKTLNYEVYNEDENNKAIEKIGENWHAIAEGQASLKVSSVDIPNSPVTIPVYVHPNVTGVEVFENTLTYEYSANKTKITSDVMNNFNFMPGKDYIPVEGELTTSNSNTCSIQYSAESKSWTIYADQIGTSTITISHSAKHTTLNAGALATNTVSATGSFDVTVVQGLTGFEFEDVVMGNNETHTITLTPVPASASFNAELISITIRNDESPRDWTLAEIEPNDETGLSWVITPKAVGSGAIIVDYGGSTLANKDLKIGQSYTMKEGWSWVTPYGGSVSDIEKIFGSNLQEMRAQEGILYNDPVYGYFGGLYAMAQNSCYKVKVKEGKYINAVNEEINTQNDLTNIPIQGQWNWIGFPYQYDHAVEDALIAPTGTTSTYVSGDRIVSKDNGFAEYDGTKWVGSLTTISAGEGYLFFNASSGNKTIYFRHEVSLGQPSNLNQMSAEAKSNKGDVWQYNSSKYADNMTIVADLGADYASSRYILGAFIGDECRGEGTFADGKWFISVHGDAKDQGQSVTFKVYDTLEGTTSLVTNVQPYSTMAGTLREPLHMTVDVSTGVDGIDTDESFSDAEVYTLDGQRIVGEPMPGIYVVKQNGKVRKVIVK